MQNGRRVPRHGLRGKLSATCSAETVLFLIGLVCGLMARAAAGRQVVARAISFKGTLQLLLAFQQQLRWGCRKSLAVMGNIRRTIVW